MTALEQVPSTSTAAQGAFASELQLRVVEARTSLAAAEAMEDPLLAQIAEADLADLQSLADRNDVEVT